MYSGVIGSLHCSSLTVGTIPGPPALHFLLSAGCLLCLEILLLVGLRPLPEDSLGALWLPARLLWPSLWPRVYESSSLSNWFLPFRGPTPILRLFVSLRPCRSRSLIPSLAPSWWSHGPLMRWALLTLSGYVLCVPSAFSLHRSRLSIPFAILPLSRSVFANGIRHLRAVALAEGRLPMRWVPSEPLGLPVAPPISPYTGPGQSPQFCRRPLELRSVFHTFPARRSASIHGDHFVSFTGLCMSQPKHSHRVVLIGHLKGRVTGVT